MGVIDLIIFRFLYQQQVNNQEQQQSKKEMVESQGNYRYTPFEKGMIRMECPWCGGTMVPGTLQSQLIAWVDADAHLPMGRYTMAPRYLRIGKTLTRRHNLRGTLADAWYCEDCRRITIEPDQVGELVYCWSFSYFAASNLKCKADKVA